MLRVDASGHVFWFGDWNDPVTTQDTGLFRDGQLIVQEGVTQIGGLTVTEKNVVRSGIPLLMELPLIGKLFRVDRQQTVQRDLIILVTPHIVR